MKKNAIVVTVVLALAAVLVYLIVVMNLSGDFAKEKKSSAKEVSTQTVDFANTKPSQIKVGITYKEAIKGKKPFVLLFYSDLCSHCREVMPKYVALSNFYADKYNFVMLNAEAPKNSSYAKDYAVMFLPIIYIVDPQTNAIFLVDGNLYSSIDAMSATLDRYLSGKK